MRLLTVNYSKIILVLSKKEIKNAISFFLNIESSDFQFLQKNKFRIPGSVESIKFSARAHLTIRWAAKNGRRFIPKITPEPSINENCSRSNFPHWEYRAIFNINLSLSYCNFNVNFWNPTFEYYFSGSFFLPQPRLVIRKFFKESISIFMAML